MREQFIQAIRTAIHNLMFEGREIFTPYCPALEIRVPGADDDSLTVEELQKRTNVCMAILETHYHLQVKKNYVKLDDSTILITEKGLKLIGDAEKAHLNLNTGTNVTSRLGRPTQVRVLQEDNRAVKVKKRGFEQASDITVLGSAVVESTVSPLPAASPNSENTSIDGCAKLSKRDDESANIPSNTLATPPATPLSRMASTVGFTNFGSPPGVPSDFPECSAYLNSLLYGSLLYSPAAAAAPASLDEYHHYAPVQMPRD